MDAWERQTWLGIALHHAYNRTLGYEEQMLLFEGFGELVESKDVPALVRSGKWHVWSFYYGGDTLEDDAFTTIEEDDLDADTEEEFANDTTGWGPFRISMSDSFRAEHEAAYGDEHDEQCPLCGVGAQRG